MAPYGTSQTPMRYFELKIDPFRPWQIIVQKPLRPVCKSSKYPEIQLMRFVKAITDRCVKICH